MSNEAVGSDVSCEFESEAAGWREKWRTEEKYRTKL